MVRPLPPPRRARPGSSEIPVVDAEDGSGVSSPDVISPRLRSLTTVPMARPPPPRGRPGPVRGAVPQPISTGLNKDFLKALDQSLGPEKRASRQASETDAPSTATLAKPASSHRRAVSVSIGMLIWLGKGRN
jgi:hypothetical protein